MVRQGSLGTAKKTNCKISQKSKYVYYVNRNKKGRISSLAKE